MRTKRIIALFCSDLHLSHTPPIFRSNEPDWYAAMLRPIEELKRLQEKHDCVVFCAGDIFDHWSPPVELVNFAITNLPKMFAIPGQHDLPNHNLKDIQRSAYWTLVESGTITNLLSINCPLLTVKGDSDFTFIGFPYGEPIKPAKSSIEEKQIAIIHQYNWRPEHTRHPGASINQFVDQTRKEFDGYNLIVCGDNHHPWYSKPPLQFLNVGTFMIRDANERNYKPQIGMLTNDGEIILHKLDTSKDVYLETTEQKVKDDEMDFEELMQELNKLGDAKHNFEKLALRYMQKHKTSEEIQRLIRQAMKV